MPVQSPMAKARTPDDFASPDEGEQCRVDLLGVGPCDVVRTALHRHKGAVGDQRWEPRRSHLERKDPILRAVQNEDWNIDLRQVGTEVSQPRVNAGVGRMR